jgi:SAM-dependent methyltransferase
MFEDLLDIPATDPARVFLLRESSFAHTLFITAVAYFDIFNRLNDSPTDIEGVCHGLGIRRRPADVLLTLLKAYRLLREKRRLFYLTDVARDYLVKSSPFDLTSYVDSLRENPVCRQMAKVLRTGHPANWAAGRTGEDWATSMLDAGFADSFTSAMNARGAYLAGGLIKAINLTGRRRLLDIGGASGIYAALLVKQFPGLTADIFEKPPVDAVARRSIDGFGTGMRLGVRPGDMFRESLPAGYDIHLLSHVIHDWDVDAVKKVLKKSFDSLAPGGLLIIHDAHINRSKTGPVSVAEYSVLLMFLSEGKCYSFAEMQDLLEASGFTNFSFRSTVLNRSVITARKPS